MSRSQNSVSGKPSYPSCVKCSKNHFGGYLLGQKVCYGCGKLVHGITECPYANHKNRDVRPQTQATSAPAPLARPAPSQGTLSSTVGCQCHNRFCALLSHQEQEDSLDVVTGMLCVFHFDVFVLLDHGSSFSYVNLLVAVNFEINFEKIPEPVLVSTPVGE